MNQAFVFDLLFKSLHIRQDIWFIDCDFMNWYKQNYPTFFAIESRRKISFVIAQS